MKNFRATISRMLKGNRLPYILSFVFQLFSIICTVFTTFLTSVLIDALGGLNQLEKASFLEKAVASLISRGQGNDYLCSHPGIIAYWIFGATVLESLLYLIRMWYRAKASSLINMSAQNQLCEHLIQLPLSYFKTSKPGDLIQTCTRDVDVCRKFLIAQMSEILYSLWMTLFCTVILFQTSVSLGAVSLDLMPFLFVFAFFFIKKVRRAYRAADDAEAEIVDRLSDNLNGVRVIKAFGGEKKESKRFEDALSAYEKVSRYDRFLESFFYSFSDIFIFLSRSLSLVFAVYLCFKGEISSGSVAISFTFVNMMVWPLRGAAQTISGLGQTLASSDRIHALLSTPTEDLESGISKTIQGKIEFEHVSFAYPDEPSQWVLKDFNLKIEPGQTVAILGKTGSGKSTLYSLLSRVYEPQNGRILIDGRPIEEYSRRCLRSQIAAVMQDPYLFSRSIEDNIAIAKPGASQEEIQEAAKTAEIHRAIESFPEGYQTPVGEKGVTLSGGQKQRVAIARSLLQNAPISFFDDSLSAVDPETDYAIRENLKKQASPATRILVTHRVSTAKNSDRIVVVDQGSVVEEGTHEELSKRNGLYGQINAIQSRWKED